MDELIRPRVYGEELMRLLLNSYKEIRESEHHLIHRADIFYREEDFINIDHLEDQFKEIYTALYTDQYRGDRGLDKLSDIFDTDEFEELYYRLVHSGLFPHLQVLFEFYEKKR